MDGFKKLQDEQDEFIKKELQKDKVVSQPVFDSVSDYIEESKIKVDKYSHKQKKLVHILLFLLIISFGLNIYLSLDDQTISLSKIFDKTNENTLADSTNTSGGTLILPENIVEELLKDNENDNPTEEPIVTEPEETPEQETPTITPDIFSDVDTKEIEDFVNQFAIGINRLSLDEETLESNTILLYITQQYFNSQASKTSSLEIDTTYASSVENFHKFLSELTIKDYSNVEKIDSFVNYIGYTARSKSYVYGADYLELAKENYTCTSVTITDKTDNIYTAKANVTRTSEAGTSTYEITFSFKVNNNYKYQKFKLLSLSAQNTSDIVDTTVHFVNN